MGTGEQKILLDADVVIHLFRADQLSILQRLFPGRILILDVVFSELNNIPTIQNSIQNLIHLKIAEQIDFPTDDKILLAEYLRLKNTRGKGESACLAVCRYRNNILASSNLRDTQNYCRDHKIAYLTTLDLLAIAYQKGIIDVGEADKAIYDIRTKGSILPRFDTIENYIKVVFDKTKLNY